MKGRLNARLVILLVATVAIVAAAAAGFLRPTWLLSAPFVLGIVFNAIPNNLRVPFVTAEFSTTKAQQGSALLPYRVLIIGQKLAGGAWTANTLYTATSVDQVIAGAGRGSMLHRQALAYFANNRFTETWFMPVADNAGGTAASGTLTVTGPATAAGTLSLYVGGESIPVAVASGDVQNTIATNIGAAITAALDLPVTASVATNVVTVTYRHKGTVGNDIDLRLNYNVGEATPAGVAVAIVAMASGATNPVLTTAIAALGDNWYHVWAHPYTDATSLTAIEAELLSRNQPLRMIDGLAITSAAGTQSTLGSLGLTRNSPYSCIVSQPGKNPLTPPCEFAAGVAGVVAYNAEIDPGRPFQTLPVTRVKPVAEADKFTFTERNLNLYDGISTTRVSSGGDVLLERLITTYQTAASGAADTSYLDATTILTLMYLRYSFRTRMATKYARFKLADDGTRFGAGQPVITPKVGKAEAVAWFRSMEDLGLVQNFDQFNQDLVCVRNANDPNRLDFLVPPNLIGQLMVTAAKIEFRL